MAPSRWQLVPEHVPERISVYKDDYKVDTPSVRAFNAMLERRKYEIPKEKPRVEVVPMSVYRYDYEGIFKPAEPYTVLPLYKSKEKRKRNEIARWEFRSSKKPGKPTPSNLLIYKYTKKDREKIMNPEPPVVRRCEDADNFRRRTKWPMKSRILEAKYPDLDMLKVDQLAHDLVWTSTSHDAQRGNFIPIEEIDPKRKTFESKSDPVAFDVKRYYAEPQDWQRMEQWDRFQLRDPVPKVPPPIHVRGTDPLMMKSLGIRSDDIGRNEFFHMQNIYPLVRNNLLQNDYVRKIPGYTGYLPMKATDNNMEKSTVDNHPCKMWTTMTASYRDIPVKESPALFNENRHSLATSVTVVNPYNPFKNYQYRDSTPWVDRGKTTLSKFPTPTY